MRIAKYLLLMLNAVVFCHIAYAGEVCVDKSAPLDEKFAEIAFENPQMTKGGIVGNLMSGLLGAVIAVALQFLYSICERNRNKKAMVRALIEECKYNIGIIDEIANGVKAGGSYKRVRDDVFVEMRKVAYQYCFSNTIYNLMARVACDEELLNNELDVLQKSALSNNVQTGVTIARTVLAATIGVRESLTDLADSLKREYEYL